jgi:hypothetical protein
MLAFDSKDFVRRKIVQEEDPVTKEPTITEMTKYYTPLGVGVKFIDSEGFKADCLERIELLADEFHLSQKRIMYDSYSLKTELSNTRAIPFCDKLVSKLTHYIELLHFSYVVMPPDLYPTVKVGGFKSSAYEIRSAVFLRNLAPMFPHISAWSYFGIERNEQGELILDGFNSRETQAWNYLIAMTKPKIFPHGDECNPYIMIADIFAYLTDAKLYGQKLKLTRENLQKIWEPYDFEVDSHFLDYESSPVYGWHSEDPIDIAPYLAHPMTFLLVDNLEKLQPIPPPSIMEREDEEDMEEPSESEEPFAATRGEKRFSKLVRRMEPWYAVTAYAYYKGGGAQLFDYYMDRKKVQDGDTMVYIGHQSKAMAESFADMLDIEVLSAKETRKAVNREKASH